ncbi:hypothetical protein QU763_17270, partial [Escherichia coli]|nr:hypothetical protein [Escherichia coli]MDM9345569.1 hypothetical protein [Escherichia coli]
KRAYCLKTQPATGETYPKSDLFNKASPDLLPRFYVEVVTLSTQFFSQAWCTVTLLLLGKIKKLSGS